MAEKARFYLEQSIPELQGLEKRKVFTKEQISAITKKRSEFEHRVNASGTKPADYARYAEYEMNLESLRKKRANRLGIRAKSHSGQRRIFFILDRATRRFHGDIGLWMQYIEYARKERASKVLARVFSNVLKLHPAKPELWIYAARYAVDENADIVEGRSHMQRGLRFNKKSRLLWLEYAKLELVFIAKVLARRRLLGIDGPVSDTEKEAAEGGDGMGEDEIKLPRITREEINPVPRKDHSVDAAALENIDTNPALNGAISLAIFDSAVKEFPGDLKFVSDFFTLTRRFRTLHCRGKLLEHVVHYALDTAPTSPEALILGVELPIIGVETTDSIFPSRLGTVLSNMTQATEKATPKAPLYKKFTQLMVSLLKGNNSMDEGVKTVIFATLAKYFKTAENAGEITAPLYLSWVETAVLRGKGGMAAEIVERGLKRFPGDEGLVKVKEGLKGGL